MKTGDFAIYGQCKVRISSTRLRGIAAPYYRFSCVEQGKHNHPKEWGNKTSYRLLSPIKPTASYPPPEITDEVHCLECDHVYPEQNPIVGQCPGCGNPDRMRTVYLQKDDSDENNDKRNIDYDEKKGEQG